VTVSAPQRAPARRRERCPSCDLPAQRGQLICLSCGTRMALDRSSSDRRAVAVAGGAMVLVAAISLLLVVTSLTGDDESPQATAPQPERARPAAKAAARERVSAEQALWRYKAKARTQLAASAGTWPAGQVGWTVVLSSMSDEASAEDFARDVEDSGVNAGVLSPEDHPALGTGVWYVFSGQYADQLEAGEAGAELALSYPGAYTQYVE
jgi:pyruvate/2-oxoglutarate dehydrogenase complex dihydrolipoamide acyltransferase (E2) component